jgi:arylsulfatase
MSNQVGHLIDIMATCVDVSGADYPAVYKGERIKPAEGQSLRPVFNSKSFTHNPIGWEHHGNRGFRHGKWKLVTANDVWELYDMEADRTELNNLASTSPGKTRKMIKKYEKWAERVGVIRWRDRKKN